VRCEGDYRSSFHRFVIEAIRDWIQWLHFDEDQMDPWKLTFHLPLHRYLSVFAYSAVSSHHLDTALFLPVDDEPALLNLMYFPLRTLVRSLRPLNDSVLKTLIHSVWLLRSPLEYLATQWTTADCTSEDLCEERLFIVDARC
jgi:hypothetical protein